MAASVSLEYKMLCQVTETMALGLAHAGDVPTVHSLGSPGSTLVATSTPPATKVFSGTVTLSGGAGALDLTSLAGPQGTTVDFSGLKVQFVQLITPNNTVSIIVEHKDGATGYNLFGDDNASDESVEVPPNSEQQFKYTDTLEEVDGTHKDVKFTGTGTETIGVILVAG